jgi:hypothetical protein
MKKTVILIIITAFMTGGCITVSTQGQNTTIAVKENGKSLAQPFIDVMKAENEFIEEILANTSMKTIHAEICFVEGLLGEARIELMPAVFGNGLQEIKAIIEEAGGVESQENFSECDLMRVHGIRWRMADALVQQAFRQYAPKVIQYLPVWLLFQ